MKIATNKQTTSKTTNAFLDETLKRIFLKENVGIWEIRRTDIKLTQNNNNEEFSSISKSNLKRSQIKLKPKGSRTKPAPAGDGTPVK